MLIHYLAEYHDEFTNVKEKEEGITFGNTLGEGTDKVVDFYGKDYIIAVEVYEMEDVYTGREINDARWISPDK